MTSFQAVRKNCSTQHLPALISVSKPGESQA
jgi:hypothetical protein